MQDSDGRFEKEVLMFRFEAKKKGAEGEIFDLESVRRTEIIMIIWIMICYSEQTAIEFTEESEGVGPLGPFPISMADRSKPLRCVNDGEKRNVLSGERKYCPIDYDE